MITNTRLKNDIINLLGTDNEGRIVEVWNECVDHLEEVHDYNYVKLYDYSTNEIKKIFEDYSKDELIEIIYNIKYSESCTGDAWCYLDNDNVFQSTNNIWDVIDVTMLYNFICQYHPLKLYGRNWRPNDGDVTFEQCLKNEEFAFKMENGDKIFYNHIGKYYALYRSDNATIYYSKIEKK